jgi:hypothetical protein
LLAVVAVVKVLPAQVLVVVVEPEVIAVQSVVNLPVQTPLLKRP